jgi:choline dehydrogenase-like flavoprotein
VGDRHPPVVLAPGEVAVDPAQPIVIPIAFGNQFRTDLDWDLCTEPEPGCDGRSLYIPRGKGLGGSSSMNAMLYVRGRPQDYDDEDVGALVAGGRIAREIAASGPPAEVILRELEPGTDVVADSELESDLRRRAELLYHPVGTCAMGDGEGAVLDAELRVRGMENLRVADASVMPVIPGGNTNAPTIMVAERAADLVRGLIGAPVMM